MEAEIYMKFLNETLVQYRNSRNNIGRARSTSWHCHSDYNCLALLIFLWTISMIIPRFITFKTMIIFFILHFHMRALVARLRIEMIIWLVILFWFIEMTSFVRLLIPIKLIIEEFIVFMLIITVVITFARATQCNFWFVRLDDIGDHFCCHAIDDNLSSFRIHAEEELKQATSNIWHV